MLSNDDTNTTTSLSEYYTATDSTANEFSTTSNSPKSLSYVDGGGIDCEDNDVIVDDPQTSNRAITNSKFTRKRNHKMNPNQSPSPTTKRASQKKNIISTMAYARAFEKQYKNRNQSVQYYVGNSRRQNVTKIQRNLVIFKILSENG